MNASRRLVSRLARLSSSGFRLQPHQGATLARGWVHTPVSVQTRVRSQQETRGRELATSVAAAAGPIPKGAKRKSLAALGGFTYPGPRKLKDIVKLPLLNAHDAAKVRVIWTEYHKHHATAVSDHCSKDEFGLYMQRTQRCPLFVVPIPKPNGFMTFIAQFQGRNCLITYLEDYKRDPSSAEPYLTFTVFDELVEMKGLALIRGEVTNRLTRDEAYRVLETLKRVYLGPRRNYDLAVAFNERGADFNFKDVLKIAEI